jgi:hypothetical protein
LEFISKGALWYSPLSRQKTTKVKIERCVVKRQA